VGGSVSHYPDKKKTFRFDGIIKGRCSAGCAYRQSSQQRALATLADRLSALKTVNR